MIDDHGGIPHELPQPGQQILRPDQLVDTLLAEKKIPFERLPPGERTRWIELVRERVLARPELGAVRIKNTRKHQDSDCD